MRRCDRRYRVEGVSAPDRVRRKANAGGTAEDFFRSFVPKSRGRKAVFSFPLPPPQGEVACVSRSVGVSIHRSDTPPVTFGDSPLWEGAKKT